MQLSNQVFRVASKVVGIALLGLSLSLPQIANAGDRRVVVGTQHMRVTRHVAPATVVVNYPNTVIYSRTPRVVYQAAPTVIINRQWVNNPRPYNYYRQWNRGWRNGWNRPVRQGQARYCQQNNRRSPMGQFRGQNPRRGR